MSEFPDLGVPTEEYTFHRSDELEEPKEEGVFFDVSGAMTGQLAVFEDWSSGYSIKTKERFDSEFVKAAEAIGRACCRVVVEYVLDNSVRLCETCKSKKAIFWCQSCHKLSCSSCKSQNCPAQHVSLALASLDKEFQNSKFYTGSAFRVSEKLLLTAEHVVKQERKLAAITNPKYHRRYTRKKICIIANHSASINTSIHLIEDKGRNCYEVEREPDPYNFKEHFSASAWETPIKWKQPFDFCMLKFKSQPPPVHEMPIAVPCVSPGLRNLKVSPHEEHPPIRYCVAGYPTKITYEKFLEDYYPLYKERMQEPTELGEDELAEFVQKYQSVNLACGGFEKLLISFAAHTGETPTSMVPAPTTLRYHRSPALRGMSGGLLAFLAFFNQMSTPVFAGMHLGGSAEMMSNVFVSTTDPSFALLYAKMVLENPDAQTLAALIQAKDAVNQFLTVHKEVFAKSEVKIQHFFE